jgi:hypothetical protein
MARQLSAVPNIDPANSEYPAGKIRDDDPPTDGTPVTEILYGDIIQFFHKLMRLAGVTYNNLSDNETSGFQFITALATYARTLQATDALKGTVELATNAETQAGIDTQRAVTPAALESKTATYARKGISELATVSETQALTSQERTVTPFGVGYVTGGLITEFIEIGAWNMVANRSKIVPHGKGSKVRFVQATIIPDAGSGFITSDLSGLDQTNMPGGLCSFDGTNIQLETPTTSRYNSAYYDGAVANRGYIKIQYIP